MPEGLTSLEEFLKQFAAKLAGMKVRPGETLKDFDARHYALESKRAELAELEKKIVKERQLDIKYQLAKAKQELQKEIGRVLA